MQPPNSYEIYTDGGSRGNPGPGASAFVVYQNKNKLTQRASFFKLTTNNVAEYFAVLTALSWARKNLNSTEVGKIDFFSDSELIVRQLSGEYKVKNAKLRKIYEKIITLVLEMKTKIAFQHIKRGFNSEADGLVNKKMDENI